MANQACLDGVGHHVGELLDDSLLGQQPNHRRLLRVPGGTFPFAKRLRPHGHQAMQLGKEIRIASFGVCDDQMLMCGHQRDGVHQNPELACADRKCVQVELSDGRIRTKEVMAAECSASDHERLASNHEAGLGHARWIRKTRAAVRVNDFPRFWRINLADFGGWRTGRQPGTGGMV